MSGRVGLSTICVYPESTAAAFDRAAALGFDGVELMVGTDAASSRESEVEAIAAASGVGVLAVHAPCLVLTQHLWGRDPWAKVDRSIAAAERFGADTVVLHPPFRWQRSYAEGFVEGLAERRARTTVTLAVENMYPWRLPSRRAPRLTSARVEGYAGGHDPSASEHPHLVLDLSHASSSGQQSLDLVRAWGERLAHVHLTDGVGGALDDHLLPGEGDQRAAEVLAELARTGFDGDVVLEVNTRRLPGGPAARTEALRRARAFVAQHLGR